MTKREKKKIIRVVSSVLVALLLLVLQKQGWLPGHQTITESVQNNTPGLYKVVKFDDGDTIAVDMQGKTETIRFIGVDTPETHDPRKPVQCYGKTASAFTKQLVGDSPVRLEADPLSGNRDRYDRLLRFIYLPNGTLVNEALVTGGYAFAITGFPHTKMDDFVRDEATAKAEGRGLWGACQIQYVNGIPRTAPE